MSKTKIQIKTLLGKLLFEHECESLRECVVQAVAKKKDLTGAYLTGAYLTGADLRGAYLTGAYLRGADLTGADLTGAYLRGEKIYLPPITVSGLPFWDVMIFGTHIKIGCETHSIADWEKFKTSRISLMDSNAANWWKIHKALIIPMAEHHQKLHLAAKKKAEKDEAKTVEAT